MNKLTQLKTNYLHASGPTTRIRPNPQKPNKIPQDIDVPKEVPKEIPKETQEETQEETQKEPRDG